MHTSALSAENKLWTFGCNDEGALGRPTDPEEANEMSPFSVPFAGPLKILGVSCGDSHTAVLTADGKVFLFGTFRDSNGVLGVTERKDKSFEPFEIAVDGAAVKVESGCDHLAILTDRGDVFTMGC